MNQDYSLKTKLRQSAISGGSLLFAIVLLSMVILLVSSFWQRNILNRAIETYTEEEAKSLARLILYDLASDARLKRMAQYEEQISILSKKTSRQDIFFPLGLKAIIKNNPALPESRLMKMAEERGYYFRLSEIQQLKLDALKNELAGESRLLEDDLITRVTFSDHMRGIKLKSKWGLTEITALEEGVENRFRHKGDLFKVTYPLYFETSLYGDVEIMIDRGKLIHVQTEMKDTLTAIQTVVALLLLFSMLVTVYVWFRFSKKIEAEIVVPVTRLAERMEKWEREEKTDKRAEKNEAKRLTSAFDELLDRVKAQREQLLKAEKLGLMERLGAGLSHELNNALNPIKLRLDAILLEGGAASKDDIRTLKEHVESARKILKDLASIHPSKNSYERIELMPSSWLSIAKRLAEPQIPQAVKFVWDYDEQSPAVMGNEEILTEIALNLILNAKDAVENLPAPKIMVSFKRNNDKADLCVEDNGAGFPAAYLEKLFEPFFTTKAQGMGLGLFIVETYVKRMGGEIIPGNLPGGGAKVTVSFPLGEEGQK
jgi:two-component system, NtrC family, nitrogen regulation sensor histidine kinase NtrY